jgi:hypothetical protein
MSLHIQIHVLQALQKCDCIARCLLELLLCNVPANTGTVNTDEASGKMDAFLDSDISKQPETDLTKRD